ncbi:hypothetical protein C0585_08325 [Candidatus Woesearchaeota archaeon]|nr:MAG: hypothetical protein C0585_08325 [Candidatus Woesearchaeota archaeon]
MWSRDSESDNLEKVLEGMKENSDKYPEGSNISTSFQYKTLDSSAKPIEHYKPTFYDKVYCYLSTITPFKEMKQLFNNL